MDLLADLLRCGWGEQMTYEEMMQIEEAKVVAEQKAWERLHEAIWKELLNGRRNFSTVWNVFACDETPARQGF